MSRPADRESISVVIPAWNAAHLLPRSIESVLAQTLPVREILVCDDGSTDNTAEVAERYAGSVRLLRQPHRGTSVTRNAGILAAAGEWIAFLDADDVWLSHKLERQMACATEHPEAGLIYCDALVTDNDGRPTGKFLKGKIHGTGNVYERLLRSCFVLPSTAVIRRRLIVEAGLFSEEIRGTEDYDLWLRLARICPFAIVPECLVRYERQENSVSRNALAMAHSDAMIFRTLLRQDLTPAQRRLVEERLAQNLFDLAWHSRTDSPSRALMAAWCSVRLQPARLTAWRLLLASAAAFACSESANDANWGPSRQA